MLPLFAVQNFALLAEFTSQSSLLMPLVLMAMMLDSMIIAVWYIVGVALGNATVKASAITEFYQLLGTAILTAIIIGVLISASGIFYTAMQGTALMKPSVINGLCNNIASSSSFIMLESSSGLMTGNGNFPGLCSLTDQAYIGRALDPVTYKIDYPLSAVGVIMANLTNQTVANFNASYIFDAYIGFQQTFTPFVTYCSQNPIPPSYVGPCIIPGWIFPSPFAFHVYFSPYAGYDLIYRSLSEYSVLMVTAIESFIAQLTGIVLFLNLWPYMIFLGLVARSNAFTRSIGGLVIAVAIGGLIFFPLVFSMEYFALANGVSTGSVSSTYGFSTTTSIKQVIPDASNPGQFLKDSNGQYQTLDYTINFFVMPSVKRMAIAEGCYPGSSGLLDSEISDIAYSTFYGVILHDINVIQSLNSGSVKVYTLPSYCTTDQALNTLFGMFNIYGILGMTAYLLPFLNIFIVLSAVKGLSGLFGGDTSLLGLGRLV